MSAIIEVSPEILTTIASRMTAIETEMKHLKELNIEQSVLLRAQTDEIRELKAILLNSLSPSDGLRNQISAPHKEMVNPTAAEILKSTAKSRTKRILSAPRQTTITAANDDASTPERTDDRLHRRSRRNDVLIYSLNASPGPTSNNITAVDDSSNELLKTQVSDISKMQACKSVNDEWKEVRYKKRREVSLRCIAGPSVTSLKAAEMRKHFHLWNMLSNTEDVKSYLNDLCPQRAVTVEQLKTKNQYNSFKIGIPEDCFDKCFSVNVWPENARVKQWINYRKRAPTTVSKPFQSEVGM